MTTTKGGDAPRRKGARLEAAVVRRYEEMGWFAARLRQGGGQIVDIVAATHVSYTPFAHIEFAQVRSNGHMTALEREQLIEAAKIAGAAPVLWTRDGRTLSRLPVRRE